MKRVANNAAMKVASKSTTKVFNPFGDKFFSWLERILADDLLLSVAVLFLPILYTVAAFSLITNIGLGRWVLPTGLSLFIISVAVLHRQEKWQKIAVTILLFLLAFALIAWATSQVLDTFNDSRIYHAKAVLLLLDGINPFYQPSKWNTYAYPAAHWLLSSSLILWTNSFEASFALTAPAVVAAFICSWRFLKSLHAISQNWRLTLAFLLVASPTTMRGLLVHEVDGLLVSVMLSVFMLMLSFVASKNTNTRYHAIYILALLILLINIKFTGLTFGAVLGITALVYGLTINSWSRHARKRLLKLTGLGTLAAVLALSFFGFFPYATNMIKHQNPFHSINKFDAKGNKIGSVADTFSSHPDIKNKSYYEKWWISLFSKRGKTWTEPRPLPPFSSISPNSFLEGFGSFFSGAMLLSLTLVLFIRCKGAWLILAGVITSIFITEAGFHIRITPQNWWIPILMLVFFIQGNKARQKSKLLPRGPRIMAAIIAACLLQPPVSTLEYQIKKSVLIDNKIAELRKQGGWYVTTDLERIYNIYDFFAYYKSGLSRVRLPTTEECPPSAEKRKLMTGLVVCRP